MKLIVALLLVSLLSSASARADWLHFRGMHHNSVAQEKLPTSWNVESGENIAWQADLPGRGPSSPIVVGKRVIVTASDGARQDRLMVLCFDIDSGKELWRRHFWATGRTFCHPESSIAAPTPASDGERIFAFFSSNDLACLDLEGNLLWFRGLAHDYPHAGNDAGMSSSPVVVGDTVIVQVESQGESFACGLDTQTGVDRWHLERTKRANWSSPTHVTTNHGDLVILQAVDKLTAVTPRDGKVQWSYDIATNEITSSVVADGKLFVPGNGVTALDVTSNPKAAEFLWHGNQLAISGSSPVVAGGGVYSVNRAGVLKCADIETGKIHWQLRLKGPVWSTPIISGGHLYLTNFDGLAHIVKLGEKTEDEPKLLGTTDFGERIQGTPAVARGALVVRSDKHLWKIASE